MKKILLGCAVAAAVSLSFNVSAHDTSGHTATNSGSVKHSSETSTSSVSNTVKTDAKKVYAGAKEYGHKAYDATKKTAKSAYDSSKHMLSSGHHKATQASKKIKQKLRLHQLKLLQLKLLQLNLLQQKQIALLNHLFGKNLKVVFQRHIMVLKTLCLVGFLKIRKKKTQKLMLKRAKL